ncbi:hypothetical protein D3C76_1594680 [compost metagenome]
MKTFLMKPCMNRVQPSENLSRVWVRLLNWSARSRKRSTGPAIRCGKIATNAAKSIRLRVAGVSPR